MANTKVYWIVSYRDNLDRTKFETFDNEKDMSKCVLKHRDSVLHVKEYHYLNVLDIIANRR